MIKIVLNIIQCSYFEPLFRWPNVKNQVKNAVQFFLEKTTLDCSASVLQKTKMLRDMR